MFNETVEILPFIVAYVMSLSGQGISQVQIRLSEYNIVRVVKSKRMRWTGHVARMGEGRGVRRVLVGKPEGKRPLGRPRLRWGIILRWIFKKW